MTTALPTETDSAPLPTARPFLKWAGGKGQLIDELQRRLPPRFDRYFEPFVGGAALFFALQRRKAILTDVNVELIDCYRTVRDRVEDVIDALRSHTYDPDHYYKIREQDPRSLPLPARAARTIYLNKTGFNGLYRVNSTGRFNVPFGRFVNPTFCNPPLLRACAAALAGVEIEVRDFTIALDHAKPGDFVYLDPPYSPVSPTANFTSYSAGGFTWNHQKDLADVFTRLHARGVRLMLSNSDVPEIRDLYDRFDIEEVEARRSINSKTDSRGKVGEVVIRNYSTKVARAGQASRAR